MALCCKRVSRLVIFGHDVSEKIILLSSDRLVRMVARRAGRARAGRARARLDAWVLTERAGGRGSPQGVPVPPPMPVPAPGQASDPLPMALARASTPRAPSAPRVRLDERVLAAAGGEEVSSPARASPARSSPRRRPSTREGTSSSSAPGGSVRRARSSATSAAGRQESDSRMGTSLSPGRPPWQGVRQEV